MNMHRRTSCWKPLNNGSIWSDLLKWTSFLCLPQTNVISFLLDLLLSHLAAHFLAACSAVSCSLSQNEQWCVSFGLTAGRSERKLQATSPGMGCTSKIKSQLSWFYEITCSFIHINTGSLSILHSLPIYLEVCTSACIIYIWSLIIRTIV